MKKQILPILGLILGLQCFGQNKQVLSDYVDPSIGTAHSHWFFYTPAAVPFGMANRLRRLTVIWVIRMAGKPWDTIVGRLRSRALRTFTNFKWAALS